MKIEAKKMKDIAVTPKYATECAAGLDLNACVYEPVTLEPGETQIIGSGFAVNIHTPYIAGILLPRSGLGANSGIILRNLVGLIDADYRQEVKMVVWNNSQKPFTINHGDKLCQMIFVPIIQVELLWNTEFEDENGL
jgi:dUTP pyrophosphatase